MEYAAPTSLDETLAMLQGVKATIVAGATDLYPASDGRALPGPTVDISGLGELRGISKVEGALRIGALTRWCDVRDAPLSPAFDGLRAAAGQIGGLQIQNAGTVAGNICNASPAADGVPPLLTLDAWVELVSARGARNLALADFLLGPRRTARHDDEVLSAIILPPPPPDAIGAFEKLGARRYLVISIAMVAALVRLDSEGRIAQARVAVGACAPVARRLPDLEADLIGQSSASPHVDPAHLRQLAPIDDARGTSDYRRDVAVELCKRAIARAGGSVE